MPSIDWCISWLLHGMDPILPMHVAIVSSALPARPFIYTRRPRSWVSMSWSSML
jgi:hypothetical protein